MTPQPAHSARSRIGRPRAIALSIHLMLAGIAAGMLPPGSAQAAEQSTAARRPFNIAGGALGDVLATFAARAGVRLSFDPALVAGRQSRGLQGEFSVDEGFTRLLADSGLELDAVGGGVYSLRKRAAPVGGETQLGKVVVTAGVERASELPAAYAGGQVARGARLGTLGNVDVMDAPFNVTAYTEQTIVDQQSGTVAEVLSNDPSVRFTTSDGHNAENFTIRGFDVNSTELAFNGMYGMLPGAHVPTGFLERVEVFKGPAAMLSGISPSGSVGGVINLVPKRAGDTPITRVTTSYLSDSRLGLALDVGRRLGEEQRFGVRMNASVSDGNTTLEDQTKREHFFSLGLDWRGERWRAELDAYTSRQKQTDGSPLMVGFGTLGHVLDAPDPTKNALRGTYATQETNGVSTRGEIDLTDQWTAYAAAGTASYDYKGYLNGTRVVVLNDAGDARGQTYHQKGFTESISAETGVRGSFVTGEVAHKLTLSTLLLKTRSGLASAVTSSSYTTNIYDPITPQLAGPYGTANRSADNSFSSLAAVDTLAMLQDRLLVTLGARHQRVQQKMSSPAYDKKAITPLAGIVVKPWGPSLAFYGNYIEGLSPGVTVGSTYANEGEVLAPYKTKQAEVGVKWEYGSFTNTLSLFRIKKPFTVSVASSSGGKSTLVLDGDQRNQGVEWNVFGQITPSLRVLGGAAYTKARQEHASTATNEGKDVPGVPVWTANLGTEWDTPWVAGLTLNTRLTHTGAQYLDEANKLEIPAWNRWDFGARYSTRIAGRPTVFRANVENVTDAHYWSGRFGDGYATLGAPRTFKLSATVDF
ncbi:MAG: TonB-dependent siderophore receptor [Candidatus Dactylopiibacterium carminicum]|uniref:TonB-dependent siderophore receptor n=1 Tax=Candidatus Dactylopiibacterium carminicum TaxID=857335 RepID=A0A272EVP3_9RHOO|nr:TonB-dependent receptor [Candidatus Dactylopiibacterium carminicum]KAF7599880.1 TonB-dependent siderophore receptor [Candidatus Dactylopiibacterium carminicum]PAS94181.1 MAG: TonB-dependent siderophore receptor [Candidatus Dactylopiibacterium carminicum]PAS99879.1 MAG: hypothetical protein BSR46_05380 [Candidatus Dactylopiibacterium carminicum]